MPAILLQCNGEIETITESMVVTMKEVFIKYGSEKDEGISLAGFVRLGASSHF